MTRIDFHFNAANKWHYACRLLRKAYLQGVPTAVLAPLADLQTLNTALWTFSAHDFLPHTLLTEGAVSLPPIVLTPDAQWLTDTRVWVNLGAQLPAGFERAERLIEVVAVDEAERLAARQRWMHYKQGGFSIHRIDLLENPKTPSGQN